MTEADIGMTKHRSKNTLGRSVPVKTMTDVEADGTSEDRSPRPVCSTMSWRANKSFILNFSSAKSECYQQFFKNIQFIASNYMTLIDLCLTLFVHWKHFSSCVGIYTSSLISTPMYGLAGKKICQMGCNTFQSPDDSHIPIIAISLFWLSFELL